MADSISMDTSEFRAAAADLTAAGSGVAARVRPVVKKGAGNIKGQLRREMQSSAAFKGITPDIDYSMHGGEMFGVGVIEAEIGPRTGSGHAGNLANVAYFGGANGGGGTVPDPRGALEAEIPRFEKALLDVLGDLLP
jgi:hypothetical protein